MDGAWPWIALALLGVYHGLNPAMGWLFAVGLGMQDGSRRSVLRALPPIAAGHELAVALAAALVVGLGALADPAALHVAAGLALVAFGLFRFARPRAHPRWTRMRVSRPELGLWSFLMASAHGAGLMVAPVLIGSGGGEARAHDHGPADAAAALSAPETGLAVLLHVGAMLLAMGVVAVLVYDKLGVRVLRKAWINLDALWASTFVLAGIVTLFT
jgi:hypothetical protein